MQGFNGNHLQLYKTQVRSKYVHIKTHAQKTLSERWEILLVMYYLLRAKIKIKEENLRSH